MYLSSIDQLISQALSNSLDVAECSLSCTSAQQPDGLVDTAEGRHINSLSPNSTSTTNTSGVFTGARVDDGINQNLEWVVSGQQMDDLESVLQDPNSHQLLSVVTSVHHEGVCDTLNNGALSLTETLSSITSSTVGQEFGILLFNSQVILRERKC
jgi:hypothetical protein